MKTFLVNTIILGISQTEYYFVRFNHKTLGCISNIEMNQDSVTAKTKPIKVCTVRSLN